MHNSQPPAQARPPCHCGSAYTGRIEACFDRSYTGVDFRLGQHTEQRPRGEHHAASAVGKARLTRKLLGQCDVEHRGGFHGFEDEVVRYILGRDDIEGCEVMDTAVRVNPAEVLAFGYT